MKTATFSKQHNRVGDTGIRIIKMIIASALGYTVQYPLPPLPHSSQYTYNITKYFSAIGHFTQNFRMWPKKYNLKLHMEVPKMIRISEH